MELTKTNGFCEMNEMEMQEVDGGGIFTVIENFLTNRLVYSNAKIQSKLPGFYIEANPGPQYAQG